MASINRKTLHVANYFMNGKCKVAEFAVTNACLSQCSFCSIWKEQPKIFVEKEKALKAIDKMADLGVVHMCFTGGESMLHPDIVELIQKATDRKIISALLVAAPKLLMDPEKLATVKKAGCDLVSISFDSGDAKIMEESRKIPNIMEDMKKALKLVHAAGLQTMASVLIWNGNCDSLEQVCKDAVNMGFDYISFNYPTYSLSNTYQLGGEGINFPKEKLITCLEQVIQMRKENHYPIVNVAASMENIVAYLKDPKSVTYQCLGGQRTLFVDWFFDTYACMQQPKPIGQIFDITEEDLRKIPACNRCNMSWYRDFSAYFQGKKSMPVIKETLKYSSNMFK